LVEWGQRNRRADALVNSRSYTATDLILGVSDDLATYLDNTTGSTEPMDIGVNWCDNHTITNGTILAAMQPQVRQRKAASVSAERAEPTEGSRFLEMLESESTEHSPTSILGQ